MNPSVSIWPTSQVRRNVFCSISPTSYWDLIIQLSLPFFLLSLQQPSSQPSGQPSSEPSAQPSAQPSSQPSAQPSSQPSSQPSAQPSSQPSGQPSSQPSSQPSAQPSSLPSEQPSAQPSSQPSGQPSSQPSESPSSQPSSQPSSMPSTQPSESPSANPSQGCDNPQDDCGYGIFNPWTCRCGKLGALSLVNVCSVFMFGPIVTYTCGPLTDCPAGLCLDSNGQCYLPCQVSKSNFNLSGSECCIGTLFIFTGNC